jgi:cell division protein FtsL
MKKLILVAVVMFSFCMHGFATNSYSPLHDIEMIEKKIKEIETGHSRFKHKLSPIQNEIEVVLKERKELNNEIKRLLSNPEYSSITYLQLRLKKLGKDTNLTSLYMAQINLLFDICMISVNTERATFNLLGGNANITDIL